MKTNEPPAAIPPTTFALAQLALSMDKNPSRQTINAALDLLELCESVRQNRDAKQGIERDMVNGLLTLTAEEWGAYLDAYPGEKIELFRCLSKVRKPREEVARALYRDTAQNAQSRERLLCGLIKVAEKFDGLGKLGLGLLDGPELSYTACRYLAEARQEQRRRNMRRTMPLPARKRER